MACHGTTVSGHDMTRRGGSDRVIYPEETRQVEGLRTISSVTGPGNSGALHVIESKKLKAGFISVPLVKYSRESFK